MKIWDYYIPSAKGEGWGKFIIDSTGYFSCVSDYGNYAFQWPAHGDDDFREFLISLDDGYLMGKLSNGHKIHDAERTCRMIRTALISGRKERLWNKVDARFWWDMADRYNSEREYEEFFTEVAVYKGEPVFEDWWEMFGRSYDPSLQAFAKRLWPRFIEVLKEELKTSPKVYKEARV